MRPRQLNPLICIPRRQRPERDPWPRDGGGGGLQVLDEGVEEGGEPVEEAGELSAVELVPGV